MLPKKGDLTSTDPDPGRASLGAAADHHQPPPAAPFAPRRQAAPPQHSLRSRPLARSRRSSHAPAANRKLVEGLACGPAILEMAKPIGRSR